MATIPHRTHCRIAFGVGERRSSHIEPTWTCIAALSIQYENGTKRKGTGQKDERRKARREDPDRGGYLISTYARSERKRLLDLQSA